MVFWVWRCVAAVSLGQKPLYNSYVDKKRGKPELVPCWLAMVLIRACFGMSHICDFTYRQYFELSWWTKINSETTCKYYIVIRSNRCVCIGTRQTLRGRWIVNTEWALTVSARSHWEPFERWKHSVCTGYRSTQCLFSGMFSQCTLRVPHSMKLPLSVQWVLLASAHSVATDDSEYTECTFISYCVGSVRLESNGLVTPRY